ncbi:MAG: DUF2313 domain-containing protein [Lachnospiraceae bacterium]|nr:DUF2313 domain-containing protein [Lachnospiraceae bacterium]
MADTIEHKKLIEYLPAFMQQFVEMKEIMKMEDIEVDRIESNIQKVLDNAFMNDCDEYGIKKYEELLHITPDKEDTLESRRARVLLRWNDTLPYTWRTLKRKLDTFCGKNNYELEGDLKNYSLIVKTHLSMPGQVQELEKMIERIIPINIYVFYENHLNYDLDSTVFMGSATIQTNHFTIEPEL